MKYLEYVVQCQDCRTDHPIIAREKRDLVTFCHTCENYFDLEGRVLRGSKKEIATKVKALLSERS